MVLFLLAAVPRLAGIASGIVELAPDSRTYLMPARNLLAGWTYSWDDGRPYSFRPPTYPVFLASVMAVVGESLNAIKVFQALLAASGAGAMALWAARRFGRRTGAAVGCLLALDPILIPVPAFILTEALGTLLVPGIVLALDRALRTGRRDFAALAGFLGGAAALNTPITLLLVPWLLLGAWVLRSPRRPDWRGAAFALGFTMACLGAWAGRNALVQGEAVLVRDSGFGSLVWATTEYDFDWLPSPYEPAWAELFRKYSALAAGRTDSEGHWVFLREAWGNVRAHPLLVLKRVIKANFWFWAEVPGYYVAGRLRLVRWVTLLFHVAQLAGLAFAVVTLARVGRLREWALWLLTIVYFTLFLSLMMPIPRYYVPLLPVMDAIIAAGFGLFSWSRPAPSRAAGDRSEPVGRPPSRIPPGTAK
jgi:4-amino-4-deoxy-L-arabinose transferase-like glycosyltransferase